MEIEMVEIGRDTGGTPQVTQWKRICLQMQEMQGTKFQSLGWEDLLQEETGNLSSILAWRIQQREEPRVTVHRVTKNWTQMSTHAHRYSVFISIDEFRTSFVKPVQ